MIDENGKSAIMEYACGHTVMGVNAMAAQWHAPETKAAAVDSEDRAKMPGADPLHTTDIPAEETEKIGFLLSQLDRWTASMERLRLADYVRYVDDRKRMFWSNFWGGIARGVGMAIGFSVLGALLVWILQDLAKRNLPLIGDILAYIMEAIRPD